jgi:myo-inositol-1(or 4)-monophosphatase
MDSLNRPPQLDERIKIAEYVASNAGSLITDLYHRKLRTKEKKLHDFVTELDEDIEAMAIKSVREQFPEDGFYGEETENIESKNDFEWVVDPIDGTNNFVRGLPLCGFQLAILYRGEPVYGLIHRPLLQEIYYAEKGRGAHYINRLTGESSILHVSERGLVDAIGILDAKVGKKTNRSTEIMLKLADEINMFRVFGVAVFDLPAIAEGSAEFLISGIAQKYDIAAGVLIINEAGGSAYNLSGAAIGLKDELVIFSNATVKHDLLTKIMTR